MAKVYSFRLLKVVNLRVIGLQRNESLKKIRIYAFKYFAFQDIKINPNF